MAVARRSLVGSRRRGRRTIAALRYRASLAADIEAWVANWNEDPKPFVWRKIADDILERLAGYCSDVLGTELRDETT